MLTFLLVRGVAADLSEFNGNVYHLYKYFEFLAYFILAFVVLQLILYVVFLVSILSDKPPELPRGDIVHPVTI